MSPLLSSSPFHFLFLLFLTYFSSAAVAVIPQTFQHTNLLRTVDLTKPYIRDSTALVLENISNSTQTVYYWGIPLELVPSLSYLEVKEKKTGSTQLFPIKRAHQDHA
jgi:oligosaccharyltransferase complex subunit alpha (ribophorin I)